MMCCRLSALAMALMLGCAVPAHAQVTDTQTTDARAAGTQETPPPSSVMNTEEDEVVATGTRNWGYHDGMKAFFDGDFEQAEIEFEREFKSLKRFESARRNAAEQAQLNFDRSVLSASATNYGGSTIDTPGGTVSVQGDVTAAPPQVTLDNRLLREEEDGKSILTDGKVMFQDFAFSRYMSGLSEIKLGKYAEAETSLKQSLKYDPNNHDARMRLGMLYVQQNDFDKAGKQLEKLSKLLDRCKKRDCDLHDDIRASALGLADIIIARSETAQ